MIKKHKVLRNFEQCQFNLVILTAEHYLVNTIVQIITPFIMHQQRFVYKQQRQFYSILRSPHVNKNSQEQFAATTYRIHGQTPWIVSQQKRKKLLRRIKQKLFALSSISAHITEFRKVFFLTRF